jgi:hypothetical protein
VKLTVNKKKTQISYGEVQSQEDVEGRKKYRVEVSNTFRPFEVSGVGGENIRYSLPKLNKLNLCKQLLILILNYTNAT